MPISDDRPAGVTPPAPPPSFVRRHPILAGFGVLSGLSLFSALWPVSAIVVGVAVAAHATGLDRMAWTLTRSVAERIAVVVRAHMRDTPMHPSATPPAPAPSEPEPSAPRRGVHLPAAVTPRVRREPRAHPPMSHPPGRARAQRKPDHPVETHIDGRGM